jgi:hypothetical protein
MIRPLETELQRFYRALLTDCIREWFLLAGILKAEPFRIDRRGKHGHGNFVLIGLHDDFTVESEERVGRPWPVGPSDLFLR